MTDNIYQDLLERGFIYQCTDENNTEKILDSGKVSFYVGFDPTADSLHVGHLLPVMAMKRMQRAGHVPIVLVGGATALVGDPSGKQEARPILSKKDVDKNVAALKEQLARFINVENGQAVFVNNADWFKDMLYLDFLREIGCRFSINRMLAAESVKLRLETGLSFLEFNYMLLQAYDFHILNRDHNCQLQLGGQDQWGNIVAGVDLVRKLNRQEVYGMTFPLLLDSQGRKFGKTAAGAVWLDRKRTSVFAYYQFWRNCEDTDIRKLLCFFTDLPITEINQLSTLDSPAINRAKEILAYEATKLAHGQTEAEKAYIAAGNKFGFADPDKKIANSSSIMAINESTDDGMQDLPTSKFASADFEGEGVWIVKLLAETGLCKSNGDARRLIQGGGAYLNDQRISDAGRNIIVSDFKDGSLILKAGKKNIRRIIIQ